MEAQGRISIQQADEEEGKTDIQNHQNLRGIRVMVFQRHFQQYFSYIVAFTNLSKLTCFYKESFCTKVKPWCWHKTNFNEPVFFFNRAFIIE